jgi:hypothetical protein
MKIVLILFIFVNRERKFNNRKVRAWRCDGDDGNGFTSGMYKIKEKTKFVFFSSADVVLVRLISTVFCCLLIGNMGWIKFHLKAAVNTRQKKKS